MDRLIGSRHTSNFNWREVKFLTFYQNILLVVLIHILSWLVVIVLDSQPIRAHQTLSKPKILFPTLIIWAASCVLYMDGEGDDDDENWWALSICQRSRHADLDMFCAVILPLSLVLLVMLLQNICKVGSKKTQQFELHWTWLWTLSLELLSSK